MDPRGQKAIAAQAELEKMLSNPLQSRLTLGVPEACQEGFGSAQSFKISFGSTVFNTDDIKLETLLEIISSAPAGNRLEALSKVRVLIFSDEDQTTPASPATTGKEWLIAEVPLNDERLFYGNGKWFSVGEDFLKTLEEEVNELLAKVSDVSLPSWPKGPKNSKGHDSHDEDWYNKTAAKILHYPLFDKQNVVTRKFNGGGLEICDLLGPNGQLICVKKASSTAPLNHLFAQGVVAVESLRNDVEVRSDFLNQLKNRYPKHRLIEDFGSLKVIFAILLKDGEILTADSLFAFAQVSLINSARRLRAMGADVEVISIRR